MKFDIRSIAGRLRRAPGETSPSIARRFEALVARQPEALAVASGPLRLTYGELGAQVDALAALIESVHGHDHGAIAIQVAAGAPLAIATFAALKLRRPCVPLDPGMPGPRRERIIADAAATLLITQARAITPTAPGHAAVHAFDITRVAAAATQAVSHPRVRAPDAPAMILYTSGSTGMPKGAVYAHGAILERIADRDRFSVAPGDRIGVFGGAGMNLFRALLRGAALVSWDVSHDGLAGIGDWIAREEITVLHCLPTLFRQWMDAQSTPRAWQHLRCVSLTGEPVVQRDVDAFKRVFPAHCLLVNGLGTTEAGTFCQWTLDRATGFDNAIVPVGHAIEGMAFRLLDADGKAVAPGAIGEIAVHGDLLAAGYWQRPELEAARFRADVHGGRPGARFYLTGDIGRQLPDGGLLHLGRSDQQVKIRGVRIEVAEVEAILLAHPDVREAAVAGRTTQPGETRLIACVAAHQWRDELAGELARHVRAHLPDAMVPDGWTFVPSLPLTPSGKIDRRALPDAPPRRKRQQAAGIVALFDRAVAQHADAVAYRCGDTALTFAELDRRSRALAKRLVDCGVGREDVVVVALPRDPAYAVALIAVLRAGGACMPLDPGGPRERNAAVLRQSAARVLLAATALELGAELDICRIDPATAGEAAASAAMPSTTEHTFDPDRLAFVLHTSGSTGTPKAVEISEGQVLHRLAWDWHARPFAPGEVACQRGTIGFVDTIAEWLGPLLRGVTAVIIADALLLNPREMIKTLAAERVSRILLVPSQLDLLLDVAPDLARNLPALRLWTASGEPLMAETVRRFQRAIPEGELWNVYGATEAWDATCIRIETAGETAEATVPIGLPLPGMRAYVVDDTLAPAPVGTIGDLYVAGDGLARGYRGDEALTRERFIPNPFSPGSGDRLYRTGDRARMREDGMLECLGRSDRLVKINGVRIGLGEIEAVFALHEDVREIAVTYVDRRLVAFVVGHADTRIDGASLRKFASARLPAVAMPHQVIALPAMPRNARGKIDRPRLHAPVRDVEPPRNEPERVLLQVFAEVLGSSAIGVTTDFFDQGGDSLLAIKLVAAIEAATGKPFRLDAMAGAPTPRGVAESLNREWPAWSTSRMTINAGGTALPLFGICGAWGSALRLLRIGHALSADIPFHALQPPDMRWPAGTPIRAMAAHYAKEIVSVSPDGPYRIIGTSFGGIMAFEVALHLQRHGHDVALLCAVDSAAPGTPLKQPPALRAGASRIERDGMDVFTAHLEATQHYVPDGRYRGRAVYFRCANTKGTVVRQWQRLLHDPLEIVPIPGVHGDFHRQPQLGAIAGHLREILVALAQPAAARPPVARWSFAYTNPSQRAASPTPGAVATPAPGPDEQSAERDPKAL